ncbi:MAG: gamma-glutamyl-gamma-aminobutyrate hydrolase family protein, partial [Pseudomonadota bacterium]
MMAQSAAVRGATRKPLIAYTSGRRRGHWLWWGARVSLWLAGARSVRVRPGDDLSIFERVDAVVLGGGDDIGAELYGGIPTPNVRIDPERDKMELAGLSVI